MSKLSTGRPSARNSKPNVDAAALMSEDTTRVNFQIDRQARNAFKAWCAENDTTIKDELTRHIYSLIQNSK